MHSVRCARTVTSGECARNRTELVQQKFGALTTGLTTKYQYPSGANAKGPHRLSSAVTTKTGTSTQTATVFEYDLAGNQTKRTGTGRPSQILTWDAEGELRQVNTTGAGTTGEGTMTDGEASFVYDASGERLVRKTAGGTTVYLPGGQEFTVQSSGGVAASRYYSFAGSTVAVRTGRGLGGVDSIVCDRNGTLNRPGFSGGSGCVPRSVEVVCPLFGSAASRSSARRRARGHRPDVTRGRTGLRILSTC
ncbi:MAG: hypothetical protein NVV70_16610 [Cellulomonas sp.]|nr:hypothetical protein [Cellulomonas sp.]MCR6649670.1 hypothetical protein [Cellulomonas sp.]